MPACEVWPLGNDFVASFESYPSAHPGKRRSNTCCPFCTGCVMMSIKLKVADPDMLLIMAQSNTSTYWLFCDIGGFSCGHYFITHHSPVL